MICVPVRTLSGETIGVMQCLNKTEGAFTQEDLELLSEMTSQAAVALQGLQYVEQIEQIRLKERAFLELVSDINSEFDLSNVLVRVVAEATDMLNAERATIFLHDPRREPFRVVAGSEISEIRFRAVSASPARSSSGQSINIPYAYADLRSIRRSTGRPASSRVRSSACRSSTRTTGSSASPRCSTRRAAYSPTRTSSG
jgi:adenylate cyclase